MLPCLMETCGYARLLMKKKGVHIRNIKGGNELVIWINNGSAVTNENRDGKDKRRALDEQISEDKVVS